MGIGLQLLCPVRMDCVCSPPYVEGHQGHVALSHGLASNKAIWTLFPWLGASYGARRTRQIRREADQHLNLSNVQRQVISHDAYPRTSGPALCWHSRASDPFTCHRGRVLAF